MFPRVRNRRAEKAGWEIRSLSWLGTKKAAVMPSRSVSSINRAASQVGWVTTVQPSMTAGANQTNSPAQWNMGVVAATMSDSLRPKSTAAA